MARALQQTINQDNQTDESLVRVFFRGFFLPVRLLWRGLAWVAHRPPLKQIGHAVRWFFRLRAVRFIGRVLGFSFVRNSWRELKSVTWPTRHEGLRLTWAVILFAAVFALLIAAVDYGLDKLFKQLLLK